MAVGETSLHRRPEIPTTTTCRTGVLAWVCALAVPAEKTAASTASRQASTAARTAPGLILTAPKYPA